MPPRMPVDLERRPWGSECDGSGVRRRPGINGGGKKGDWDSGTRWEPASISPRDEGDSEGMEVSGKLSLDFHNLLIG
jgi:hypothetical protein